MIYLRTERFRAVCERRGWTTVAQQAQRVGLSRSSLIRIMNGVQRPRLDTVGVILRALDEPFDSLFVEADPSSAMPDATAPGRASAA